MRNKVFDIQHASWLQCVLGHVVIILCNSGGTTTFSINSLGCGIGGWMIFIDLILQSDTIWFHEQKKNVLSFFFS